MSPTKRINCRILLTVALAGATSCSNSQGLREDQRRISGVYVLHAVDGLALPATVSLEQGCSGNVTGGELSLNPAGVDALPAYGWSVAIETACIPVPPSAGRGTTDVGSWNFGVEGLAFRSLGTHGTYAASLEEKSGDAPKISVPYLGHSYQFVLVQPYGAPTGVVYTRFLDEDGQPVVGVVLTFVFPNGRSGGGQTPASGEYGTSGVIGEWTVSFVPPAGFTVPASQSNPFTISVSANSVQHITVSLVKP